MFELQSPSKYFPFDAIPLLRWIFRHSKQFLNSFTLMPFSASILVLFCFFHIGKMFPFDDFFHPRKTESYSG